jgi:hypothetical protein
MLSKENFRSKSTEKKYIKLDLGESGFNCVNWIEIKETELRFFHCTHPCQYNKTFLWSTDSVMTYIWEMCPHLKLEGQDLIPDVILSHKCHFTKP